MPHIIIEKCLCQTTVAATIFENLSDSIAPIYNIYLSILKYYQPIKL